MPWRQAKARHDERTIVVVDLVGIDYAYGRKDSSRDGAKVLCTLYIHTEI